MAMDGEARVEITKLFSALTLFQARHRSYFGDFRNIGYDPKGQINRRIGFAPGAGGSGPVAPASYRGPGAPAGTQASVIDTNTYCGANPTLCEESQYSCLIDLNCLFQANSFLACASGKHRTWRIGSRRKRVIRIDEGKVITERDEVNTGCNWNM
jgi:hypothetical protein